MPTEVKVLGVEGTRQVVAFIAEVRDLINKHNTNYMIDEVTGVRYKLHVIDGKLTMTEVTD